MKIDLHHQLLAWRRELAAHGQLPWSKRMTMKIASFVLRHDLAVSLAGLAGAVSCLGCRDFWFTIALTPGEEQRELPPMPRQSFREQYRDRWGQGK